MYTRAGAQHFPRAQVLEKVWRQWVREQVVAKVLAPPSTVLSTPIAPQQQPTLTVTLYTLQHSPLNPEPQLLSLSLESCGMHTYAQYFQMSFQRIRCS